MRATRERFMTLEKNAHQNVPQLTPEAVHAVAKEVFMAFGKDASDTLDFSEFLVAVHKLGIHWSEHRLRPLFRLGDMDDEGWLDFRNFEYVLLVASQMPAPGCVSLWEYFLEFSKQNYGFINDFEFWKIVFCSTTLQQPSIEDIEKKFLDFRDYSHPTQPEYILRYDKFKLLWCKTVCDYGRSVNQR